MVSHSQTLASFDVPRLLIKHIHFVILRQAQDDKIKRSPVYKQYLHTGLFFLRRAVPPKFSKLTFRTLSLLFSCCQQFANSHEY